MDRKHAKIQMGCFSLWCVSILSLSGLLTLGSPAFSSGPLAANSPVLSDELFRQIKELDVIARVNEGEFNSDNIAPWSGENGTVATKALNAHRHIGSPLTMSSR